jgi:hypothetical protein
MADHSLEALKAAQLAYARSNASLADYNPAELSDEEKVKEEPRVHDIAEPIQSRPEDSGVLEAAKKPAPAPKK